MGGHRHRLIGVAIGVLLVAGTAGAWIESRPVSAAADAPLPWSSVTTAAPARAPAATTTTTGLRPIDVPADPYAPEPVRLIGRIEIPRLGVVDPLYDGVTLHNIDLGPSHWPGTAMPGQPGNVVVAGHRVTHSHPFLHIDQLVPGDRVTFVVAGVRSVYVVTSHEIVTPAAMWIVNQTPAATATLFACHPPHSAAYRYVVHLVLATS